MTTATLDGKRATAAAVHLPAWGVWWAELVLDEEATLSGAVELELPDLTLSGAIMSGGPSKGKSTYRVAGGAGLWGTALPSRAYANDAGVKVSTILSDAAQEAGETLDADTLPTTRVGPAFVRHEGPASRVLEQLTPRGWYVGEDGVTRIGRRQATALAVEATRGILDPALGVVELAADSLAGVVPGVIVDGLEAVDVVHDVSREGGLRSTIYGAGISSTSRRLDALRRIVEGLDPFRRFRGTFEYRVVTLEGERLNLQPVRVSSGMPDLRRVQAWAGIPGGKGEVQLGSRVLVTFVDALPSRPAVVGFEGPGGEGFAPVSLELVGEDDDGVSILDSARRVVRYGDTITFPVGAAGTPTELPVEILTAQTCSRVKA